MAVWRAREYDFWIALSKTPILTFHHFVVPINAYFWTVLTEYLTLLQVVQLIAKIPQYIDTTFRLKWLTRESLAIGPDWHASPLPPREHDTIKKYRQACCVQIIIPTYKPFIC